MADHGPGLFLSPWFWGLLLLSCTCMVLVVIALCAAWGIA